MKIYKDENGKWRIGDVTNPGKCGFVILGSKIKIFAHANDKVYYYGLITDIEFKDENDELFSCVNEEQFRSIAEGIDFFVDITDGTSVIKNNDGTKINPATSEKQDQIKVLLNIINESVNNSGGSTLKSFSVEITRPANQTPYTAGDVVADTTAAFIPFANVAKAIGTGVKIVRVRIQTDDTAVAGTKFNVHLYKDAPTFISDNSPFAVAYANATKRVGAVPVVMGTGNLGTVGMNDYNIAMCNPVARNIYFIIETVSGFTASANSTKFTVTIDCELSNN